MKWLLVLLFFPSLAFSQLVVKGKFVVGGTSSGGGGGGTTVLVDTSKETIYPLSFMSSVYDATRPNKLIDISTNCTYYMNSVPLAGTGTVTFVLTGTCIVQVNGIISNAFPTTGTFTRTYTCSNIGGLLILTWT